MEAAEAEDAEKKPKKVVYGSKKPQKKKEEPTKVRDTSLGIHVYQEH